MKKILVLMLALIVLAGCAQTQDGSAEEEEADETPVGDKIQSAPSTVLSIELREQIDAGLTKGTAFVMPLNYRKMNFGDSFVFGIGLQNIKKREYRFSVDVTFKKAYDRMTNIISVDEDLMDAWVKSTLKPFNLAQNDKKVISIVLEAGNIRPGIKPSPGTYVFNVDTYYSELDSLGRDDFASAEVSVKIQ